MNLTDPCRVCRCGWSTGDAHHPCHGRGYACRAPATQRFYGAHAVALAGVQMKVAVIETWACDACWAAYTAAATMDGGGG